LDAIGVVQAIPFVLRDGQCGTGYLLKVEAIDTAKPDRVHKDSSKLVGTYAGCVDGTALLEKQGIVRKK
jgi:hypothetical protein